MSVKIPNISQSLMKELYEYKLGNTCGLQIKAKYIDGVDFPSSDVQRLGQWFEYKATGAKTRSGQIPEPDTLKNGNLAKKYEMILQQVENFRRIIKHYKIKILSIGKKIEVDGLEGTFDIEAEVDGRKSIIDLKTSGLLYDKWNELGWDTETLPEKEKLMTQVVQYKLLTVKQYGEEYDFYFLIFSNTNPVDSKFIKVDIDAELTLLTHEQSTRKIRRYLKKLVEEGFRPLPDLKRCHECPIKENCKHRMDVPVLETVYLYKF